MLQSVFLTRLLTLGILFSTAVNAAFASKLLTSGILFFNLVRLAFLTKSHQEFSFLSLFCLSDNYFLTQSR